VKNQRKVILLGDSHVLSCSEKLADLLLGNSYSVIGITKPRANTKAVTDSVNLKAEKITRNDVVILCGGTRDIAKNEANIGLRHISQFANSAADTNVIVTCAPTRFDLQSSSCVNKEVNSFNRKLHKSMKIHSHIQVCSISTIRDHLTIHGFHMNTRGKNWIANTWASIIKTLRCSSLLTPIIPLPEKNR
jgi:lysophospholipase L1-like esterase